MVERRLGSDAFRRRGEAALVLGEGVGVERVLPGQVLCMHEGIRARDAGAKGCRGLASLALAVIGVAGRGEIGLRQLSPRRSSRPPAMRRPRPTP